MSVRIAVLHFIPGLHVRDGGPSQSVVRLTDALAADDDLEVTLVSHSNPHHRSIPSSNARVVRRTADSSWSIARKSGLVDRKLVATALGTGRFDLLHIHSLWHLSNHWAMRLAQARALPVVCQPRGMLEPWALRHKAWKKKLALWVFHRADLERVNTFIATSHMEIDSIRRMGFRQPVACIPNGVDEPMPGLPSTKGGDVIPREKVVLFLSRIHPVKGILDLLEAWSSCRIPGWRLIVAGPDEGGHLRDVLKRIESLGLSGSVKYVGELAGEGKAAAYRSADLFVLPSYGENFGLVVAEALSYGLPVITTQATPWPDLPVQGCGWWIPTGAGPLAATLREAMLLADSGRAAMGEKGRIYVRRFQWGEAAKRTIAVYRWILKQGDRPEFVNIA